MAVKIRYSVILPVYKQQGYLSKIVKEYSKALKKLKKPYEVIITINGPLDNYDNELREMKKFKNFIAFKIKGAGFGLAVNYGLKKAKGEFICFTNSANTNPNDVIKILYKAEKYPDSVIKAKRVKREEDSFRMLGSYLYSIENRILFKTKIRDINAFPTAFHKDLMKKIKLYTQNSLWDAEFLAKCISKKIPIILFPVNTSRQFSKKSSTNMKTAVKLYTGIIGLRFNIKD
ncbi:MAG: hypothetical protein A2152_02025 [Candidatus Levybacteria bacterium RBG_16_35_6]|nr:MAG: hypothetical protein A2152_02025 [Candidatus Levybacteria bacterium RBG_16_35_6]